MERPYIICHMVASIDGKVTGSFLFSEECRAATEIYYRINRETKRNGFICGRVTMEESFTGGYYPDLNKYAPVQRKNDEKTDFKVENPGGFYAIAFDTHAVSAGNQIRLSIPTVTRATTAHR